MGILDEIFGGTNGVTNILVDLLGTEVVVEFEVERVYREDTETALADAERHIVPAVVIENGFFIAAANLQKWIEPEKTRVHLNKRVYQVVKCVPVYAGNTVHGWNAEVIEI